MKRDANAVGSFLDEQGKRREDLARNEAGDVRQDIAYGLPARGASWVKGYLKGEIAIHVHFRYTTTLDESAHEMCLFIKRKKCSVATRIGGREQRTSSLVTQDKFRITHRCANDVEHPMLVFIPKFLKQPEGMVIWRPTRSIIRLQPINNCLCRRIQQTHFAQAASLGRSSSFRDPPKSIPFQEDGKLRFRITISTEVASQLPNEVIERRAEIIEAFADEQPPIWGRLPFDAEAQSILPRLRIELSDWLVGVICQELPDIRIECCEMFVRSFESQDKSWLAQQVYSSVPPRPCRLSIHVFS